ncbi:signal recognition particle-docking protein FtsY, partial [bacterium]
MFKRLMQSFDRMAGRGVIDDDFYDELEEALLQADTNVRVTQQILDELREAVRREKITDPAAMRLRLQQAIAKRFEQEGAAGLEYSDDGPSVFVFVGVNGVGKTTTIAKVANFLTTKGFSVIMAAGDTFRAAAIEQLEVWADRTGSQIVRNQPGGDSAAVLFDAITAAKARNIDFVLADTAGRQHSKGDLMNELQKVVKTICAMANN